MQHTIDWFEIFVADLERAKRFYELTLGVTLERSDYARVPCAVFKREGGRDGVGGSLVQDPKRAPGAGGSLVYLSATGKLDACLERVKEAGGSVMMPKTDIGEPGFIAILRDTEGNLVGLHSER
jgi:predicted enzyme related to lactoylglutathione lyase